MLFYINESVADAAVSNNPNVIVALKELLQAWRRNRCFIDGKRRTLEDLSKIEALKDFGVVAKRKQGLSSIYTCLDFFVQLAMDYAETSKNIQGAQGRIVPIVGKDLFFFASSYLLCENIRDGELYTIGAEQYAQNDLRKLSCLNIEISNGGGHTMAYELQRFHNNRKLTLTICDSDRKYPSDKFGDTSKSIVALYNSLHSDYLWHYVIDNHEVENLIPMGIISSLKKAGRKTFLKNMKSLVGKKMFNEFFQYFDFKKGLSSPVLRALKIDYDVDWQDLNQLLQNLGANAHDIKCALCRTYQKGVTEKYLLFGWGDDLLKESVAYMQFNNLTQKMSLLDYQKKDWINITRLVYSIGCAPSGILKN